MRVLLDECVPRALRVDLPGHEVKTVDQQNFSGLAKEALKAHAAGKTTSLNQDSDFQGH